MARLVIQQRAELMGGPHDGDLYLLEDGHPPIIVQLPGHSPPFCYDPDPDETTTFVVHRYRAELWRLHLMAEPVYRLVHRP